MAITQTIATLPAVLNDSATFYEDIAVRNNSLVTVSFPSINTWATQANALAVEVNDKAAQVAAQAVDGGYSQTYINTNFVGVNNAQNITEVKTFTISPIVPNATTATQAMAYGQGVNLTTAQTIAGVKTFSSSPIVPTPTTGTQAVNKYYADSVAVELATDAEIRTGTDNTKAITPLGYNQTTFGWGQTWQNMTASRTSGVTYTNNTGKPIMVLVSSAIGQNTGLDVVIAGSIAHSMNHNATAGVTTNRAAVEFIVPSGVTYKVTAIGTAIANWNELR